MKWIWLIAIALVIYVAFLLSVAAFDWPFHSAELPSEKVERMERRLEQLEATHG